MQFGIDVPDDVQPEKHVESCGDDEVAAMYAGYEALDQRAGGAYAGFLSAAAGCRKCREHKVEHLPINLLCGAWDGSRNHGVALRALAPYRRADPSGKGTGSLRFDPATGTEPLREFLAQHGLRGLSVGHCGWGDMTARVRGAQLSEGVDMMVLGADWYPLTGCSNFLVDRYAGDHTLHSFIRNLRQSAPELPADLPTLFRDLRLYIGNTLLCYRTGFAKTGTANLSRASFDLCREHLQSHIAAVAPRVLVTFGREPARSCANLLAGDTTEAEGALAQLRQNPRVKCVMEGLYARQTLKAGIPCELNGRTFTFVPLCHPSMPNRYHGDYDGIANVLRARPGDGPRPT